MSYRVKRKILTLGRVVLPVEIRRSLNLECGDDIEITLENGHILIEACQKVCIFCGSIYGLKEIGNHCVCRKCMDAILAQV